METILFDGHNLAIRCGKAPHLSGLKTLRGEPTGEAYGVLHALAGFRRRYAGQKMVVVWEGSSQHRRSLYPAYKGKKRDAENDFGLRFLKDALPFFGVEQAWNPQEEADDVIASIVKTSKDPSERFVIVSTDRDYWQLVDERVALLIPPAKSGGEEKTYTPDTLRSEFGLEPSQMVAMRSLCGDVSDCIVGIMGFGPGQASKAIRAYGSLDALFFSDMKKLSPMQRERLGKWEDRVRTNAKLMTLRSVDPITYRPAAADVAKAAERLRHINAEPGPILDAFFPKQLSLLG